MFAMRYRNIGLKIAYYRKKKGYTQTELAQRIGMSVAYLGQIERGNRGNEEKRNRGRYCYICYVCRIFARRMCAR